uniref:CASP-like protein n=1 Tax=Kalanchoe fedtschenkoi TaxID=63787 RepID=A0A7N0T432_KALFE
MENNSKLPKSMDVVGTGTMEAAISKGQRRVHHGEVVLRLMGFVLTIMGAILVGFDRQTRTWLLEAGANLPPLELQITAKYQYMSTMVFFVIANAIVCTYAAVSLAFYLMASRDGKCSLSHVLIVTDALIMGFLLSADGAAAAVGIIGRDGNSHLQWHRVCYMFNKFCNQGAAAVVLSTLGSVCLLLLVALSASNLHKKLNHSHVVAT